MTIVEGDRFKHIITGQLFKVKIIKNGTIILECEDTPSRWWIGNGDVDLFFETTEKRKE
jgi:hypothetical protein